MRLYFLSDSPPLNGIDLDPRRSQLYGEDVVWLRPDKADDGTAPAGRSVSIGPFWGKRKLWHQSRVAARDLGARVKAFRHAHPDGVLMVGCHELAIPLISEGVRFAFDPTDSASLYHLRRARVLWRSHPVKAGNSLRLYLHYRSLERTIAGAAAVFVTTGPADEAYLRKLEPSANVLRVGNGTALIDQPAIEPKDDGRTIGFHGGMTWEPNRTTAQRLAGPVATALCRSASPAIRIRIAGRPVPDTLATLNNRSGVEVDGFVEDLQEWMASLSLYVMPMYQGSGVKNKLIEALAAGLPVLTNPLGAEAIPSNERSCLEMAEDDNALIEAIPKLLANPSRLSAMRREGRRYAEQHFRWDDHRASLMSELDRLKKQDAL